MQDRSNPVFAGHIYRWIIGSILPVGLIIVLELAVRFGAFPSSLSAAPSAIATVCISELVDGTLVQHALLSVFRIASGVALGAVLGFATGIIAALSKPIDDFVGPTIRFLAPIPAVVWLPFSIMFFGTGEVYKISLTAFVTFLLVYIQAFQGVRRVPKKFIELAEMNEKSKLELVRQVLIPSALPACITGLRIALAIGWIAIFIVEYSSAEQNLGGLGWYIADSREVGRIEEQFAGVLILGVLGFVSDLILSVWQHKKLNWSASLEDWMEQ